MKRETDPETKPTRAPALRLSVLGAPRLADAAGRPIELPTRKSLLLLAYLAVPAGIAHARDKLADLLWPTSGQDQARGSLRHALAALRKALGPTAIDGARDQVRLNPGLIGVDLDAVAAMAEGRRAPELSGLIGSASATFLDGVAGEGDALDEWLAFERTRARTLLQGAFERAVEAATAAGRFADSIALAERLVALDPLREHSHRVLMRTFVGAGERSKALAQFRALQALLKAELGAAPSASTAALARAIQRDDAATGPAATAPAATVPAAMGPAATEAAQRRIAIAVLPFQGAGPDESLQHFAEAFSSDLVAALSRNPEFSVIAWQSSAQVSGSAAEAARSAVELQADYALAGSIRSVDGRMRIGAQLVATSSRAWVWAERYDLDVADMRSAEDRIVAGIVGAVDAGVRRVEREAARAKPLANLDAWSLFHRGMWHVYRFSRRDVAAAEDLFAAALRKDPAAGAPHAGLAYACIVKTLWRFTDDLAGAIRDGLGHAREAVARDELDAHAHTVLGRLLVMAGDSRRGIEHLERAIELNPSLAHAHYGLGHALYVVGRPADALVPLETALSLSPKDPLASMFLTMAAFCHLMRDDIAAAETAARRARSLLSRETWSRLALAATLRIKGDDDGARKAVDEAREIEPDLTMARFAPLVQHIPPAMRDRILAALAASGLPEP
jgi:DNA-binding SARP family transcriptional activator